VKPLAVEKILDKNGAVIYKHNDSTRGPQVLEDNIIARIVPVMQGVVQRGTGTRSRIGRPSAGKTGTTNGFKDTWFVGFTPDIAAAVWLGNDDNMPLCSGAAPNGDCRGSHMAGGDVSAPIWRDFMKHASAIRGYRDFQLPNKDENMHRTYVGGGGGGAKPGEEENLNFNNELPEFNFDDNGVQMEPNTNGTVFDAPRGNRQEDELFSPDKSTPAHKPPVQDEENLF
jgi:membrane peptidoglycan carboxypeptidase